MRVGLPIRLGCRAARAAPLPSHGLQRLVHGLVQLEQIVDVVLGERVAHPVSRHHREADIGLPGGLGDDDERATPSAVTVSTADRSTRTNRGAQARTSAATRCSIAGSPTPDASS
jgi:hypothetical protein